VLISACLVGHIQEALVGDNFVLRLLTEERENYWRNSADVARAGNSLLALASPLLTSQQELTSGASASKDTQKAAR
jgi:hypothetical protein